MNANPVIHLRFGGRSEDISMADLDIGQAHDDNTIRNRVADHLEVPQSKLVAYEVVRHENGNMTLHPEATFA